jgi:hypothetical protein
VAAAAATTAPKIPKVTILLAVPPLVAEKKGDSEVIAANSPAVAPAIVSWPRTDSSWPASLRTGTTSPRDVAARVMARKNGSRTHPTAWKAAPAIAPSSGEPAGAVRC